ncbi:uncharacterized protein LOC110830556 isoform X2 [Zootermopsis nevadensis]|uniref:uncharacterized protein LOC110830556 isoform X2 n=1 Tax=Zootermopsis nevadensis TaxID=136037 RepID=UPI000B8E74F8|nr:uncharacterized protein LOC110830556 isoform X2 [Zootermopsis nevadensis]
MNYKKISKGYSVMMAMMMVVMVSVSVSGTAITEPVGGSGVYQSCEADHECDRNKYCYKVAGICVPCTDCKVYYRQKPALYPNCPKVPLQCGECLPGYEEEILTEGEVRSHCIPTASPQGMPWIQAVSITVGILLALICIIIFFVVRRFWKKEPVQSVEEDIGLEDQSPPPYSGVPLLEETHVATAPTASDFVSEICETSLAFRVEKEDQPFQQAVPFTNYQNFDEPDDASEDDPLPVQDEETVESMWGPPPGYGQQASASNAEDSNNETGNSEVTVPNQAVNVASAPDSGLSNSSCGTSSNSLPQRPFEALGSTSSSSLSFQQPPARSHSLSDEDVSIDGHSHKRARRDSGTQSLGEDSQPVNVMVINVQQIYKCDS